MLERGHPYCLDEVRLSQYESLPSGLVVTVSFSTVRDWQVVAAV
jgi:hypothetical protein